MYDVTSRDSFDEIDQFHEQILQVKDKANDEWVPTVLVGNKCDLDEEREVPFSEGSRKALLWKVPFFETSALTGFQVDDAYHALVREIWRDRVNRAQAEGRTSGNSISRCVML